MKAIILSTAAIVLANLFGIAQKSDKTDHKKIKFIGVLGVARSTFDVSILSPKYPTLELRLGAGIVKPFGKFFELKSGLYLGLKVKRESYFIGQLYTQQGVPLLKLDEASSNRNHFVVDMPLVLQLNVQQNKVGFRAGFNARFWKPNNDDVDVLTNRTEVGILLGITRRITRRVNSGLDFYYGLTDVYGGSIYSSAPPVNFYVRNQFAQLTLEYSF